MDIDLLRAATPGTAHRVHLNNAGAGLLSVATLHAMTAHLQLEAHIGGYEAADAVVDRIADVYAALAELVDGRASEIALFDSSTRAWLAAFHAVPLRAGDRVLVSRHTYGSNLISYQRSGAEVVVVPDDEHGQIDVDALARLVDDRTKLISLCWVPTGNGLVNPAAEVGRVARAADVPYLLDATQVVGQLPVDVDAIGCDLLTGTGRKFLRGPRGTGFLWVRTAALARLEPHVAEIRAVAGYTADGFTWAPGARRFEAWEHSYVSVLGFGAAVRQALELGVDATAARVTGLGEDLRTRLDALPGVRTHDIGRERCAIVTASVEGHSAADVTAALAAQGINVSVTVPADHLFGDGGHEPLVRLSPHYFTTEAELDQAAAAIGRLNS